MKVLSENDKLARYWRQAMDYGWPKWHAEAFKDRQYYEGRQWTPAEIEELKEISQPAITINHIYAKINALLGLLLQQRPQIKCLPRGKHDAELAHIATLVIRYIMDINDVRTKLAEAFLDMLTAGIGWLDARASGILTKDPIVVEYVPWHEVVFDPLAKQPDLSDARFVFRWRFVDRDDVLALFPDAEKAIDAPTLNVFGWPIGRDAMLGWADRERVLVVEAQWKELAKRKVYWDGFQAVKYDEAVHGSLVAEGIGEVREAVIPVVKKAIIVGSTVVHEEELPYLHGDFTLIPFIAFRDVDGLPVGVVRMLRDVQDEINKRRSKVLHYLTSKRVIAEKGAVDDPDEFMEELQRPDAFLTYNRGFQLRIESDLDIGAQHFQLMQEAIQEMSMISGIYQDFLGIPTNARTAAALRQRVMQSLQSVQKWISAVERGLKVLAEHLLALAKQFYTTERLIQITDEPEAIVLNEVVQNDDGTISVRNSLAKLRADIVVTVQQGGSTERQEQLAQLVELFKVLPPQLIAMSLDILIDAFDVPQKAKLKERLALLIQAQLNQMQGGGNGAAGQGANGSNGAGGATSGAGGAGGTAAATG